MIELVIAELSEELNSISVSNIMNKIWNEIILIIFYIEMIVK